MQFTGQVTHVGEIKSGTGAKGPWASQQFVMTETSGPYPRSIVFDVFNDKIALNANEICTVHLETKAKEYNGRWFNDVKAWKKEGGVAATHANTQQALASGVKTQGAALLQTGNVQPLHPIAQDESGGLPF